MYKYRVYNITRDSNCIITSDYLLEVGQTVLVHFDNPEVKEDLCECKILEILEQIYH